jgi:V8-like Glu-specific endopeptidase
MLSVRDGGAQPRARSSIGIALAGLALFAWAPSASAQAPAVAAAGDLVPATKSPSDVREYWTATRMRDALPIEALAGGPLPILDDSPAKRGSAHKAVRHVRRFPNRTHGKVFFHLGAFDYFCSGTSVSAPSHSLVWTAGHCVAEPEALGGSTFATNWMFVPAQRGTKRPFGEWPATSVAAPSQWTDSGGTLGTSDDFRYDFAAATVASNGGQQLEQAVGARGIGFNSPREQTYRAFGYPAESPPAEFDGRHMFKCKSPYSGADNNSNDPKPMRMGCDMTGGSSGGGWIGAGGNLASNVSYGYNGSPNYQYGPYLGGVAQNFYNQVKNG